MRRLTIIFILAISIGITNATPAEAARHMRGQCGIHRGRLVIPFLHRYHVRIGVKRGHVGGSHRCRGAIHRRNNNAMHLDFWAPFDLRRWNWRGILDVGSTTAFTAAACSSFAGALIGEVPSVGSDTFLTAITAAGCITGGKRIQDSINANFRTDG